MYGLSLMQI